MKLEDVKDQLFSLPEVPAWPDLSDVLDRVLVSPTGDWEWPVLGCRAVGGDESQAAPLSAAIICAQLSIILVDDILDADPRGMYHRIGEGKTANLALALQAASLRLVDHLPVDAGRRAAIISSLADMALATAYGQSLDVQGSEGEAEYWNIVQWKSTPFYGAGLYAGAVLGGAEDGVATRLRQFGILNGEIIQIHDDLRDALQVPVKPDWRRGNNNLAILYALTADHPERERFSSLLPQTEDREALGAAQEILVRCGAISYCAYAIIRRYQAARRILDTTPLADPAALQQTFSSQIQPIFLMLEKIGSDIPPELKAL